MYRNINYFYFVDEIIFKNIPQMLKKYAENMTGALYNNVVLHNGL
jgi:hypothetical protein